MSDKHLILWADPQSEAEKFLSAWESDAFESIEVQEENLALQFLKVHQVSILVASSSFGFDFWKQVQSLPNPPVCVLILKSDDLVRLDQFLNSFSFFRVLKESLPEGELRQQIESCIAEASFRAKQKQLRRESSKKYRELESLNQGLEKIVEERTRHIEMTKIEEEDQLLKVRNLIRFIKDLTLLSSVEELLQLVRKEVRKLGQFGDPLLLQVSAKSSVLYSYQSGHYNKIVNPKPPFRDTENLLPSSRGLQRFLANELGRPFVTPLIFELRVASINQQDQRIFLALESFVAESESDRISAFFSDRLETLTLALDRIFLESEYTEKAYLWEQTFDSLQRPIAILDVDYEVLRSNRLFSVGQSARSSPGKKCYEIFAQRESPCEGCPMAHALESGQTAQGTIRLGSQTFQVYSYPIILSQGRPTNAVNSYIDITQSRELYLKLLQSEKMSALGVLAGNIAHELNNPLTGIRSLAQVLMHQVEQGSTLHADLGEIEKATERSQKIIRNLQEFSRKENSTTEIFSLDEIIEKTIPMLKALIRNHRLDLELHAGTAKMKGEPQLIQQVIFNLINNACQAMKTGGVVTVTTEYDAVQKRLALVVKDTGPGIPKEVQDRIFEAFFTTKKEGFGTGLGLSLSKDIVARHDGTIEFSSDEGQGTEFRVLFDEAKA